MTASWLWTPEAAARHGESANDPSRDFHQTVRYILNTSFRPDHTGGNEPMRARLQAEAPGAVEGEEPPSQRTSTSSRE